VLEVQSLVKSFDLRVVLNNVSFKLTRGEVAVVVGPNASGKTTLLKCIAGLLEPDSGTIIINGEVIFEKPPGAAKPVVNKQPYERSVGYSPPEPLLFPHLTVRENLELPLKKRGWSRSDIAKRVAEVLEVTGLKDYADSKPHKLSTGLLQKASIARALVYEPAVLLLDEPFSAIDPASRPVLRSELRELFEKFKTTVLLTTHLLDDVLYFKQRVLVLVNGVIAYNGELSEEAVVKSAYLMDALGFVKLRARILECLPDGRLVADFGGWKSVIAYNKETSSCREGDALIALNPGHLNAPSSSGEDELVELEAVVKGFRDRIVDVEAHVAVGDNEVRVTLPKTVWSRAYRGGGTLKLSISREHVHVLAGSEQLPEARVSLYSYL